MLTHRVSGLEPAEVLRLVDEVIVEFDVGSHGTFPPNSMGSNVRKFSAWDAEAGQGQGEGLEIEGTRSQGVKGSRSEGRRAKGANQVWGDALPSCVLRQRMPRPIQWLVPGGGSVLPIEGR